MKIIRNYNLYLCLALFSIIKLNSAFAANYKENFSTIYSFGDSFSYNGTWSSDLSKAYGIRHENLAVGGAIAADLQNQFNNYKNSHGFDKNAVYTVMGIASEFADSLTPPAPPQPVLHELIGLDAGARAAVLRGNETLIPVTTGDINPRTTMIADFVNNFPAESNIVVFNAFNDSLRQNPVLPGVTITQYYEMTEIWRQTFNKSLYAALDNRSPNANVIYVDYGRLLDEIAKDPAKYLTNNNGTSGVIMPFFDTGAHPTKEAHKLTANYVISILDAPAQVSSLREIPVQNGLKSAGRVSEFASLRKNFEKENTSNFTFTPLVDYKFGMSPAVIGMNKGRQIFPKYTNDIFPGIGVNYFVNKDIAIGAEIDYFYNYSVFHKKKGNAKVQAPFASAHVAYHNTENNLFGFLMAGAGKVNYDITRKIELGKHIRSEKGKTKGNHSLMGLGLGYNHLLSDTVIVSPTVNIIHQSVSMNSFREKGEIRSTLMEFKVPKRQSTIAEFGLKTSKNVELYSLAATAHIKFSYLQDFQENIKKRVDAKLVSMPRWFKMQTYETKKPVFRVDLGLATNQIYNIMLEVALGIKMSSNKKMGFDSLAALKYNF